MLSSGVQLPFELLDSLATSRKDKRRKRDFSLNLGNTLESIFGQH